MKAWSILPILAVFASPVLAGTFTVTNTNDAGAGSLREAIAADDRESAIVETLAPGAYTAIVRGKNDTTGVALVEAYHLN